LINPILIRQLKDVLQMAKTKSKTLIILGCRMVLPPELKRRHAFSQRAIEYGLPTPKGLLILPLGSRSPPSPSASILVDDQSKHQ
jgi:hypothetical protein